MKLKTYQAPSLHAALRLARIELGSEAVLLEAKERDAETAEARFQVTFALGAEPAGKAPDPAPKLAMPHWKSYLQPEPVPEPAPPASLAEPTPPAKSPAKPRAKPRAKTTRRAPRKPAAAPKPQPPAPQVQTAVLPDSLAALRTPELAAIFGRLAGLGVTPSEATALALHAADIAGRDDDAPALRAALRQTLDAGWLTHAIPEPGPASTRLLALVGPAGAGKSSTTIKAAMLLLHAYGRRPALISLGRQAIGGADALEAWATLLNLPMTLVESPQDLPAALDRLATRPKPPGAILLDVASDPAAAQALAAVPNLETHLVLPATYSLADMLRVIERYRPLAPAAAIFTRLDEAAAPGSLWNLQRTAGLAASYLGCGPDTPADLQPATPPRLTELLLGR